MKGAEGQGESGLTASCSARAPGCARAAPTWARPRGSASSGECRLSCRRPWRAKTVGSDEGWDGRRARGRASRATARGEPMASGAVVLNDRTSDPPSPPAASADDAPYCNKPSSTLSDLLSAFWLSSPDRKCPCQRAPAAAAARGTRAFWRPRAATTRTTAPRLSSRDKAGTPSYLVQAGRPSAQHSVRPLLSFRSTTEGQRLDLHSTAGSPRIGGFSSEERELEPAAAAPTQPPQPLQRPLLPPYPRHDGPERKVRRRRCRRRRPQVQARD